MSDRWMVRDSDFFVRRLGRVGCLAIVVVLWAVVGCNDAKWREASAARQERIKQVASWYAAHDAAGSERIEETLKIDRELAEHRADHLEYTIDLIHRGYERDVRRWHDQGPRRDAALRKLWNAHPETIPDTWARMVY